jgi:ribosome-binding ATPase
MKVGIIGLPQAGKKTLFEILTGNAVPDGAKPGKPVPGASDILDSRFNTLVKMYAPKKQVRARLDLVLLPKLESEAIARGDIFRDIADMDAVCHVIRAFEDDAVYHAAGSVNAWRDFESVNAELLMHDQIFAEKRIQRLTDEVKKIKDEARLKELALMQRIQEHLETETPLRLMALTPDEKKMIRSYPFITQKKLVIAVNVAEDDLGNQDILDRFKPVCQAQAIDVMLVSAKVEAEIALLDDAQEKQEFMAALGIERTALEVLTRLCLGALNRISFFTVGKDEVRQWLVRQGSTAPRAAGVIHSDLERGFIRAEVFSYDDLIFFGSEAELKKNGRFHVEGKEYVVKDGDILNIRFSV